MSPRRAACAAVAAVVLLLSRGVAGEPIRFVNGAVCTTAAGSRVELAPRAVVYPEAEWVALDQRLVRLDAENASLRKSAAESRGWVGTLVTAVVTAGVAGLAIWAR